MRDAWSHLWDFSWSVAARLSPCLAGEAPTPLNACGSAGRESGKPLLSKTRETGSQIDQYVCLPRIGDLSGIWRNIHNELNMLFQMGYN